MTNPEIGRTVRADGLTTNLHDAGAGSPVVLVHGSGPGVSAWANWRGVIPRLSQKRRVIAPDMVGFGYTDRPVGVRYNMETWIVQLDGLFQALEIKQADLVGNSFGGALALAFGIRFPERVRRLVLMGSVGVHFEITPGLDAVWGYQPSLENMRGVLDYFCYHRELITDDLAALRFKASTQPGFQEAFASMFPAPRQRWVEAMASPEDKIRLLRQETLIIHGRDDRVIPTATSLRLNQLIERSQLHIFGQCGHWVQIEQVDRFTRLVDSFLAEGEA
jgi:pimeloyl-ACP methyl ester carboxylesterase